MDCSLLVGLRKAQRRPFAVKVWQVATLVGVVCLCGGTFARYVLTGETEGWTAVLSIALILQVLIAMASAYLLSQRWERQCFVGRLDHGRYINVFLSLVAVGLSVIRLRSPEMLYGDIHFEAVFYSVTQGARGHTLLADLPAQYGLYAEFLGPFIGLTGLSVFGFSILHLISLLALVWILTILVKHTWLRLLSGLTIFFFVGSTWLLLQQSPVGHEYFQIWPWRFFFPALVTLGFLIVHRLRLKMIHIAWLALLAGIGLVWNFDWGLPAYGALVAYFLLCLLSGTRDDRQRDAVRLALVTVTPLLVCAVFIAYLDVKSDGNLSIGDWLKYQFVFYSSGFGMLPMPRSMHAWVMVFALYLCGLGHGVARRMNQRGDLISDSIMMLSVMGIGIFSYYQGRSHDIVLSFVLWPAILITFTFADRILHARAIGKIPSFVIWINFPVLMFGLLSAFALIAGIPRLASFGDTVFRHPNEAGETIVQANVRFIRQRTGDAKSTVILNGGQSVLFAETGLASAVPGPGMVEMLLQQDLDQLLATLIRNEQPNVFIDANTSGELPEPYRPLIEHYVVVDVSSYGLLHLQPRPTSHTGTF